MSELLNKIIPILAEYSTLNVEDIHREDSLENLQIDSLSLVEIIFDLEEQFDIKIPDEAELNEMGLSMEDVGNIETLVLTLLENKKA